MSTAALLSALYGPHLTAAAKPTKPRSAPKPIMRRYRWWVDSFGHGTPTTVHVYQPNYPISPLGRRFRITAYLPDLEDDSLDVQADQVEEETC